MGCYKKLFVQSNFPDGHCFQQDNALKHTSCFAGSFIEDHGINWWKTLAESLDLNLKEMLWYELKHFLLTKAKPKSKQELIDGIQRFWEQKVSCEVLQIHQSLEESIANCCYATRKDISTRKSIATFLTVDIFRVTEI